MKKKFNVLLEEFDTLPFKTQELEFNSEYVEVMSPVASAIDILQGDTYRGICFQLFK